MLLRLRLEVGHVDVAGLGVLHDDDLHARHHRARRVRAVRRLRNQAHVALVIAARLVILPNHEQSRVLALRSGVRLQRHRGEPGDFGERLLETVEHLAIALRLLDRRERMHLAELRPGDRIHLRRRVQLHRARAERDHRRRQRQIARLETLEVPQHLGLGVVAVEDRVREERRRAREPLVVPRVDRCRRALATVGAAPIPAAKISSSSLTSAAVVVSSSATTTRDVPSARRLIARARAAPTTSVAGRCPISTQTVSKKSLLASE